VSRRCHAPRTVLATQSYLQAARLCCRGCSLRAYMESSQPSALQSWQTGASSSRAGRGLAAAEWEDAGDLADRRWLDAVVEFLVDYDPSSEPRQSGAMLFSRRPCSAGPDCMHANALDSQLGNSSLPSHLPSQQQTWSCEIRQRVGLSCRRRRGRPSRKVPR